MDQRSPIPPERVTSCLGTSHELLQSVPGESIGPQQTSVALPTTDDIPAGYPKLAKRMELIPEIAIFRRFGFLNQLNALYMQAELKHLEEKLKKVQRKDSQSDGEEKYFTKDFFFLNESGESRGEQFSLVMSIREKLDKYSTYRILNGTFEDD